VDALEAHVNAVHLLICQLDNGLLGFFDSLVFVAVWVFSICKIKKVTGHTLSST